MLALEELLLGKSREDGPPEVVGAICTLILRIEHELDIHIKDARAGLRPLDVAAQPEAGIGNTAQHAASDSSRTQVSLLPPPCEELTTSEPLRMATRVSPPGTIVVFSPMRM